MWKAGKLIKQIMKAYENCDLYVKRAYLRCIYNAEITKNEPSVYNSFQNNLLIVRRSDRLSADLSSVLVILQVLLRSIKTIGGLTRRRGFTDSIELYGFFQHPLRLR